VNLYRILYNINPTIGEPLSCFVSATSRPNAIAAVTAAVTVPAGHTLQILAIEHAGSAANIIQGS
jgi:hypothetical protein